MCKKLLHSIPAALVITLLLGNMASAELIAHWPLNGHYGDATGNGHDGTPLGDPEFVVDVEKGLVLEVDGNARVMVDDAPDLNFTASESLTMTVWVLYDPGLASSGWRSPCGKGRTAPGGNTSYLDTMYGFFVSPENEWASNMGSLGGGVGPAVADEWHHLAFVQDGDRNENFYYINLEVVQSGGAADCSTPGRPFFIGASGSDTSPFEAFGGRISDVRIYDEALSGDALAATTVPLTSPALAHDPLPNDKATGVPLDVVLSWTPGEYAPTVNGHRVYLSANFDDVNDGVAEADRAITSDPEFDTADLPFALSFGTTYHWRIDEANDVTGWDRGSVWSFSVEPFVYSLSAEQIIATASSTFEPGMGPENTINGSGLDADDLHSAEDTDMWQSAMGGPQPAWIQYEFDRAYKMYEMWVWNFNVKFEDWLGIGFRDVTIETSIDGIEWVTLGDHEFTQGPGEEGYAHNTIIDLQGVMAQYIRLTANTHWGTTVPQSGLSEVRFYHLPVQARDPQPADGETGVSPDAILSWRGGREAAVHEVFLGTDEAAVADEASAVETVTETSYDPDNLELGTTYYWKVNEVNEAESPATWQGDVWSFETAAYLVVDDFEGYDDDYENFNRIFQVWIDGAGYTQPEPGNPGNGSGALVGTNVAPWVERTKVHSGRQSMPLSYDNSVSPFYSEAGRTFETAQDWTKAGVTTLTLYFYGDPANSTGEKMYVKINGVEVPYDGASSNLTHGIWQPWNIELASLVGIDLQNVTEFIIGFSGSGSGVVTFDDIRLNPPTQMPDSQAPDDSALVAHWDFEGDFTDATGKGHDGLAFGDPTIVNDPLRGQVLVVDGDDRIGVSDAPDLNFGANESLTLTIWANLDLVDAPEGWKAIVAKGRTELGGGTDYVDTFYGFYVSPSNNWNVNAGGLWDDSQAAAGGQWHHLAFVQDGPADEGYFYIDGELIISGGADSCDTTERPLFIGAAGTDVDVSAFESFKGRIDDVRIYSYALSQLEIQYLALDQ